VPDILVQRLASELNEPTLPARYLPIRRFVEGAELRGIDLAEAAEVFAAARERAARLGVTLHLPKLLPASRSIQPAPSGGGRRAGAVDGAAGQERRAQARCSWPVDKLYVTAGGELLPCCMVGTPDRATFGNAFDDGLDAVWNGEAARQWRSALGSDDPGALCRGCALYRGTF
jgi:radical SAM protein with 4Fe4S-binding SPASM domain